MTDRTLDPDGLYHLALEGEWEGYRTAGRIEPASLATEGFVHRMYVLQSTRDDPAGPYRFKAQLRVAQPYAIDATVAVVRGRAYLLYSGGSSFAPASLLLAPLSNPWTVAGTPIEISRPALPCSSRGLPVTTAGA